MTNTDSQAGKLTVVAKALEGIPQAGMSTMAATFLEALRLAADPVHREQSVWLRKI